MGMFIFFLASSFFYVCVCLYICVHFQGFVVEVQLDSVKQNQKESIRRTLFLDSQKPSLVKTLNLTIGERSCHEATIYLRVGHVNCFYKWMYIFEMLQMATYVYTV